MMRTTARAAGALALALLAVVLVAAPAHAAAYRYWTYWQSPTGSAAWAFATQGAGTWVPADGDVEGWAFGITTASADPEDAPGAAPDFAAICASTPAEPDRKRVALVIDAGPAAVAPDGDTPPPASSTCVVAAPDATGYEILRSVVEVRTDNGLVCGLGGYPSTECAPVLDDEQAAELLALANSAEQASATAPETDVPADASLPAAPDAPADGGSPIATIAVVGGLAAVTGVLVLRRRRVGRSGG
jgi:hypothetical protein